MTIVDQVLQSLKKYADFAGRASRSEFWTFFVFVLLANAIARMMGPLGAIISLALLVPQIAVATRRLHDVNRSGRELLVPCLLLLGMPLLYFFGSFLGRIVALGYVGLTMLLFGQLLLLLTRKGSIVPNRYGACPTAFSYGN